MPLSKAFFDAVRPSLYAGEIAQTSVTALNAIFDECVKRNLPINQIAYIMATPYHEVGSLLIPNTKEYGWQSSGHAYAQMGAMSNGTVSKVAPYNNLYYYGRGLPQITWLDNYQLMAKRSGKPYDTDPDSVLNLFDSVWILVEAMQYGLFGIHKPLGFYVNNIETDYVGARRTWNGTDKASIIAGYAYNFLDALKLNVVAPVAPIAQGSPKPVVVASQPSLASKLWGWLKG